MGALTCARRARLSPYFPQRLPVFGLHSLPPVICIVVPEFTTQIIVRSWSDHGQIMVGSWSDHDQIMVRSWSDHGQIMIRSWSDHGQIMIRSLLDRC
jgi:hypothetical protein